MQNKISQNIALLMEQKYLVEVQNLKKIFKMGDTSVAALKGIDIKIKRGEFIAIMGTSGSGKSTLLNIIGCLEEPTSGSYLFSNRDVFSLSDVESSLIRAHQIGFVFQTFNLIHQLNILENVEVPFIYQDIERNEARNRALRAIEQVGLKHRIRHRPSELSGGELQRVAIARALAINPSLILADEPTGNLDFSTSEEIMKLFHLLNQQGSTILLVTHDKNVARHAQRKLYLFDGKLNKKYEQS